MSFSILVAVSAHGLGHAMPTVAVLNALRQVEPDIRLTLMTRLPRTAFSERLVGAFDLIDHGAEFGMRMDGPLNVCTEESFAGYQALVRDWTTLVEREADVIGGAGPDLVLSNISFLAIAGAQAAGVPVAALCSFNWLDVFRAYCGALPGAEPILNQLRDAYARANLFLRVSPGTPMAELSNTQVIGPIGSLGSDCRAAINDRLGLSARDNLTIADLGGISGGQVGERLPIVEGVHWLLAGVAPEGRPDVTSVSVLALPFIDILASADAVVTKPGYGTFVEAACNATRVLYVQRGVWPEEPYLVPWLEEHGCAAAISRQTWQRGAFADDLSGLLARPLKTPALPSGNAEAATAIAGLWRSRPKEREI